MTNTIKFYHNGLKINGGKLQACAYCKGKFSKTSGIPEESIVVYKCYTKLQYNGLFSKEVSEFFIVLNENPLIGVKGSDTFLVFPEHPSYPEVLKAFEIRESRIAKKYA